MERLKGGEELQQVGTLIILPGIDSALFDFELKRTILIECMVYKFMHSPC